MRPVRAGPRAAQRAVAARLSAVGARRGALGRARIAAATSFRRTATRCWSPSTKATCASRIVIGSLWNGTRQAAVHRRRCDPTQQARDPHASRPRGAARRRASRSIVHQDVDGQKITLAPDRIELAAGDSTRRSRCRPAARSRSKPRRRSSCKAPTIKANGDRALELKGSGTRHARWRRRIAPSRARSSTSTERTDDATCRARRRRHRHIRDASSVRASSTVLIGGQPAAVIGRLARLLVSAASRSASAQHHRKGSATVMIGKKPAARVGDTAGVRRADRHRRASP